MELRPFEHTTAASLEEAAALLAGGPGRAAAIAGGTDLLGVLKDNIHPDYPGLLVDLKALPGMGAIAADRRGLRLGALATLDEVAAHPAVREAYPALAAAAGAVASPQIRNMATVGGNICQEPRCWYYRYPENQFFCSRKGGNGCPAVMGENRYHSIFGAMRAIDPPCSRDCPAHIDIAAYLSLVRAGDIGGAAALVLERQPPPGDHRAGLPALLRDGLQPGPLGRGSVRAGHRARHRRARPRSPAPLLPGPAAAHRQAPGGGGLRARPACPPPTSCGGWGTR